MNRVMTIAANSKFQKIFAVGLVALVLLYPVLFPEQTYMHLIICTLGIYIIVNSGFDILFGYSGQISLGQAGFYAIGAYFSAILSKAGLPVLLSMLLGASIAALVGYFLAIPCSKLVHHFLAIVHHWLWRNRPAPGLERAYIADRRRKRHRRNPYREFLRLPADQ